MRESIGNTFVFNFVIITISVIMLLIVGSMAYSKAFKIKNNLLEIVDKHRGYTSEAKVEIETFLGAIGYRVSSNSNGTCPRCEAGADNCQVLTERTNTRYRYCVYQYEGDKTIYYGVTSFMYFDLPVIGQFLEFPIFGQTESYYKP